MTAWKVDVVGFRDLGNLLHVDVVGRVVVVEKEVSDGLALDIAEDEHRIHSAVFGIGRVEIRETSVFRAFDGKGDLFFYHVVVRRRMQGSRLVEGNALAVFQKPDSGVVHFEVFPKEVQRFRDHSETFEFRGTLVHAGRNGASDAFERGDEIFGKAEKPFHFAEVLEHFQNEAAGFAHDHRDFGGLSRAVDEFVTPGRDELQKFPYGFFRETEAFPYFLRIRLRLKNARTVFGHARISRSERNGCIHMLELYVSKGILSNALACFNKAHAATCHAGVSE